MANTVKIEIGSALDPRGFDAAESRFRALDGAAADFFNTLKMGVGIDLGGRLVQSLAEIPAILQQAIVNGVRFNAELESAKLGVAAVLKQFDSTGKKSFDGALRESAEAIELLKQKAMESPATFQQLVAGFQAVTGAATGAGIKLNDQVQLIVLMSQALAGLGIRSEQIIQESRALVTGNINEDAAAARILGITKQQIELATAQGQLYEFLSGKLAAFAEAGKRGESTLITAMSNMEDAIVQLQAKIAEPVFEALREGVLALNEELKKPEVIEALKEIGYEVAQIVEVGMDMIAWAVRNAETLSNLAHVAGILGVALAAMKIAEITTQIGAWALQLVTGTAALEAETAALARNTTAQVANAAARGAQSAASTVETAGDIIGQTLSGKTNRATAVRAARRMNREVSERVSSKQFLDSQRQLRPGGTSYVDYTKGRMVPGGSGLSKAVPVVARAAAEAPGGWEVKLAAAALAAGVAIGVWTDGIQRANEAIKADARGRDAFGNKGQEQLVSLIERAMGAGLSDYVSVKRDLENQIAAEQEAVDYGSASDDRNEQTRAELAGRRRDILKEMLADLESFVAANQQALDQENAQALAEEKRAAAMEDAMDADARRRRLEKQDKAISGAVLDDRAKASNPFDRVAALEAQAQRERSEFARLAGGGSRIDPMTASPTDMMGATKNIIDAPLPGESPQSEQALQAAQRLADVLREIQSINEANKKDVDDQLAAGAKEFQQQVQTRQDMELERDIVRAQAAGQLDVAATAERRRQIEAEVRSLMAQQVDEVTARKHAEEMAELKLKALRDETLKDLESERAIMAAKIEGNTRLVEQLERERAVRQDIKTLEGQGLSHSEAKKAAEGAALDKQALENRGRDRKLEEMNAEDAAARAAAGGSKTRANRAADKAFEVKRRHELEDMGYDPETVNQTVGSELQTRKRGRGTIGGPTQRSKGEGGFGGGLTDAGEWADKFTPRGIAAAGGTMLDGDPTNRSPLDKIGHGLTAETDWRKRFPGTVGEMAVEPSNRPGGVAEAQGVAKGGGNTGAQEVEKAGQSGQKAGGELGKAATALKEAMETVTGSAQGMAEVAPAIAEMGEAVTTAIESIKTTVEQVKAQVDALARA